MTPLRKLLGESVEHLIELIEEFDASPQPAITSIGIDFGDGRWVTYARLASGKPYKYAIYTDPETGQQETDGY